MTKQEFIRMLKKEAENAMSDKASYRCLAMLMEIEFNKYGEIEIETNKRLVDVYKKMREYAQKNKEGSCGCCPPSKAVEIAIEAFGIKTAKSCEQSGLDIDILDLLGD